MTDWIERTLRFGGRLGLLLLAAAGPLGAADLHGPARTTPFPDGHFVLERGEVVAFVGGADVAAAQQTGHLEALLAVQFRGLDTRFRNFGWEGDTVFAQPRDVGFPPLAEHLRRAHATVIVLQFGRAEALAGRDALPRFRTAYEKLLDEFAKLTPRTIARAVSRASIESSRVTRG